MRATRTAEVVSRYTAPRRAGEPGAGPRRRPVGGFLLVVLGMVVASLAVAGPAGVPAADEPVVVVLVRHAEKAQDDPRDPNLSEAGHRRAQAVAAMFGPAGVTHLFSSEYRRTRQTLAPMAEESGLEVKVIPAEDGEAQVAALRELPPGSVAIVAGHSNTVPALVRGLGGDLQGTEQTEHGEMLQHEEYDRMFVVILPPRGEAAAGVQTLELRYGE